MDTLAPAARGGLLPGTTLIASHLNLDFDALASLLAAAQLYPGAQLALPDTQEQNVREYLKLMGKKRLFTPMARIKLEAVARLVLVDTRQRRRLGRLAVLADRGIPIDLYDHHPPAEDDLTGGVQRTDQLGATVTMLVEELERRGLPIGPDDASLFLLGIYEDTGSLAHTTTTPRDLAAASRLLAAGANLDLVRNFMHHPLSEAQRQLTNRLMASLHCRMINGVPVHFAAAQSDSYVGDVALIAHKLRDLENLPVLFVLAEMEHRLHIVARSTNPAVRVGELLAAHGGGGHASAASVALAGMTAEEGLELLVATLAEKITAQVNAADVMTSPVRTVRENLSIGEAKRLLLQLDCSALVVTSATGAVRGIITHRDIDKALQHGLEHAPVKGYMATGVVTAPPGASLHELQRIMLERQVGRLPVVAADGKLAGIVTRSDLMRALFSGPAAWRKLVTPRATVTPLPAEEIRRLLAKDYGSAVFARLAEAGETAQRLGMQAFLVGGMVRDLILGAKNLDIDIVIAGNGIGFGRELGARWGISVKFHERFMTAKLHTPEGVAVDVATARVEYYAQPAALPEVTAGDIVGDLSRRDFTINAAAVALNPDRLGEFVDPHFGYTDLLNRELRILHPHSFVDDPSRILRALLFAARGGFALADDTQRAFDLAVAERRLGSISPTRLRPELVDIFELPDPRPTLALMAQHGILSQLHPAFTLQGGVDAALERLMTPDPQLVWREDSRRWRLVLLTLLMPLAAPDRQAWLHDFGFAHYDLALAKEAARWREDLALLDGATPLSAIDRRLNEARGEYLDWLARQATAAGRQKLERYLAVRLVAAPTVAGDDLIALGVPAGPRRSELLAQVRARRVDGLLHTADEELAWLRRAAAESAPV